MNGKLLWLVNLQHKISKGTKNEDSNVIIKNSINRNWSMNDFEREL